MLKTLNCTLYFIVFEGWARGRESYAGATLRMGGRELDLSTLRSGPEPKIKRWIFNQLSHPGTPELYILKGEFSGR